MPSKKPAKAWVGRRKDKVSKNENEPKTTIPQRQSRTGRTIKPTAKMRKGTIIHILMTQLST